MRFALQRRGLRKVVSSEKVGKNIVILLECGHTVTRAGKSGPHRRPTAFCKACGRVDGTKRDLDKVSRDEAAE